MGTLELYVQSVNGDNYWAADGPDTPEGRRELDRLAWAAMRSPRVLAVSVTPVKDRRGGYRAR